MESKVANDPFTVEQVREEPVPYATKPQGVS
jgi:hypothetical protein